VTTAGKVTLTVVGLLGGVVAIGTLPRLALGGHGAPTPSVAVVPPDYVKRLLEAREPIFVVDVRTPTEFRAGHLPSAVSLPLADLDRRFPEIPKTQRVLLYCHCPMEEIATAYVFLFNNGYRNHAVLGEGFQGWLGRGYPVAR